MTKMITVYETSDGAHHRSRAAADRHDELIELEAYVNENRICNFTNAEVIDGAEFMEWLKENPRIHTQLLPEEL